ncbi:endonuclease/exonuclease/phosphatase family protein [Streptomyces sp. HPF1205]|uniref:endonuclease/exonuclease/phosphatase family protein n=1 Tax=Streptomyces sp. HPF1205 TaxID=2873262 RepID=UPI001CED67B9|nr:endonuclease/exonuclease/phosphatase family protein [Streptomyces sp. HPF1205]
MKLTVVSQNCQVGADKDGRWKELLAVIRGIRPHLLMLQEVPWLTDPDAAAAAEQDLGLSLAVAPSRRLNTAVAWDPAVLEWQATDTEYAVTDMHHGYCAPRFTPLGLAHPSPAPLVAISTHLTPYSAQAAAQEAQILCARAYRYGGVAIVAGDINHCPLDDPEIPWEEVPPYNRTARCVPRASADEPWRGNRIVGQTFRDGEFTDVAAHFGDHQPTGKAGLLRVDQAHVTPAVRPALRGYRRLNPTDASDHYGITFDLDLTAVDADCIRTYT